MSSKILKKSRPAAVSLVVAAIVCAIVPAPASAQFLYNNYMMPKVQTPWADTPYDTVLFKTWQGIKATLVDAYPTGMVHRPKSNRPDDAVSEGISYGMFLALYMNDQAAFNSIWEAGVRHMWKSDGYPVGYYYDWRRDPQGNAYPSPNDNGPASDADQDIALLLIFADQLASNGVWRPYTGSVSGGYAGHARQILESVRTTMVANGVLLPGRWGGEGAGTINPGYFAPAFYRVFAEFDQSNAAAWNALVESSYDMIAKSPGYARGLLPDWFTFTGGSTGGAGYNAYLGGDAMYRDAIRIYWRLATDYLWYREPRAKTFLDNAMAFISGKGGPTAANFYQMDGELPPENDVEILAFEHDTRQIVRSRREHSHLTLGMWAAAAMGSGGPELAKDYSDELLRFYQPGTTYWGIANNPASERVIIDAVALHPTNPDASPITYPTLTVYEDTAHNEMYFDQFLAWFGASILAGNFTNVWEDLKDGVPTGPPEWKTRPPAVLPNWNIGGSTTPPYGKVEPFVPFCVGASFTRSTRWTVTFKHDSLPGNIREFSDNSDTVYVEWSGLSGNGAFMPQGWYTLTINAGPLSYETKVWLGSAYLNQPNLLSGNRLLVDDFADGDIFPYFGKAWQTFSDAQDGGNSNAVMRPTGGNGGGQLEWDYDIRSGFAYAFIALDWNYPTTPGERLDLTGVDSIIFVGRSKSTPVNVSVQLIDTDDRNDYTYFEDSISFTTTTTTHKLPLSSSNFKQRLNGSNRTFGNTLQNIIGIRMHIQYEVGAAAGSDALIIEKMYFAGPPAVLSGIYTPPQNPPEYVAPPEPPVSVSHRVRARMPDGFAIRKIGNSIRVTVPQNMVGANVSVIDVRGRTVRRVAIPPTGMVNILTRDLASGMYFVEVRKRGVRTIRMPVNNVR